MAFGNLVIVVRSLPFNDLLHLPLLLSSFVIFVISAVIIVFSIFVKFVKLLSLLLFN